MSLGLPERALEYTELSLVSGNVLLLTLEPSLLMTAGWIFTNGVVLSRLRKINDTPLIHLE